MPDVIVYCLLAGIAICIGIAAWNGAHDDYDNRGT